MVKLTKTKTLIALKEAELTQHELANKLNISHWINGNTGEAKPFSTYDDGGDIVETAYMAQGLLTIRQYFNGPSEDEQKIVQLATDLWEGIEWDWYRKNGSNSIYWHWSPNYEWLMNMMVRGWNQAAIV